MTRQRDRLPHVLIPRIGNLACPRNQAWTALQPTPQETHFRVVREFCKKQAQKRGDVERAYVGCVAEFTQNKKL